MAFQFIIYNDIATVILTVEVKTSEIITFYNLAKHIVDKMSLNRSIMKISMTVFSSVLNTTNVEHFRL